MVFLYVSCFSHRSIWYLLRGWPARMVRGKRVSTPAINLDNENPTLVALGKNRGKLPRRSGAALFGHRKRRGVVGTPHVAELYLNLQRCHVPNAAALSPRWHARVLGTLEERCHAAEWHLKVPRRNAATPRGCHHAGTARGCPNPQRCPLPNHRGRGGSMFSNATNPECCPCPTTGRGEGGMLAKKGES